MKKISILLISLMMMLILFEVNTTSATLPGKTTIILLNEPIDGYHLGDTVEILLTAEANQIEGWGGNKDIAEFTLTAYYDSYFNSEYEATKTATRIGSGEFKAQFSFTLTKNQDATLTIEGRAFDTEELPGAEGKTAIYVYPRYTSKDESTNGDTPSDNSVDNSTPGFELILITCALALILLWKRKRD